MHDVTLCFDYMQVRWWCQIKQGKNQKYGANAPHLHHISPQAAPGASPPLHQRWRGGEARTLGFSQPSGASIAITHPTPRKAQPSMGGAPLAVAPPVWGKTTLSAHPPTPNTPHNPFLPLFP